MCNCAILAAMARGPKRRKIDAGADKAASAPAVRRGDPLPAFVDPQLALLRKEPPGGPNLGA
jgi:hypothetical protein